jgi:hypothetical protein
MPAWKVLLVVVMGLSCLALGLGTIIVPISMAGDDDRWLWLGGLLLGTIIMTTLFVLFLRSSDRNFKL